MKAKKTSIFFLLLLLIFSGFGRDYIMVNINWVIKHLTLGAPNYAQEFFNPLLKWKTSNLLVLKWGLTIVFSTYFFFITYNLIRLIFNKSVYLSYTKYAYVLMVGVSATLYVLSYFIGVLDYLYPAIRTIMGVVQSFIPFMVLFLMFKFIPKLK